MKESQLRKSIRLTDFNYSNTGYYYITICVKGMRLLLSNEPDKEGYAHPSLSAIGEIVEKAIENIPNIYESISIDKYVIMPNHIHMIMSIENESRSAMCAPTMECGCETLATTAEGGRAMRAPRISTVVNQMKGYVTKQIGYYIWQKLYYDHVIRDEADYRRIWQYIDENPARWHEDEYNT